MAAEPSCLMDTGPLVAALNAKDRWHGWAQEQLDRLPRPFATCEAVLSEAAYLTRGDARRRLFALFDEEHGLILPLSDEVKRLTALARKYEHVPMDIADACLVRLSEKHLRLPVVTLDSDFRIYRRNRAQKIPLIAPFA